MSKEKRRVPKLRFPGFTEDWERRKLTSFTQRVKGNDGRMDLPTLTISASEGWLNQKDRFSANIAGSEQKNYTLLRQGELSYNHGNSKLAKYGVVYALQEYKEALVPRVYHSFKVDESYDALFVEYYFSTKRPDRELRKLISSGARMDGLLNIGYDEFTNISISLPTFSEQKQIVALLKVCVKNITVHQRKIEHLNLKKKALLQKLFPKNGECYPEHRFPGFTDAWEQRKLGDFTNQINTFVNPEDAKLPLWSLTAEAGLIEKSDRYERDFLVKKKDQFKRIETNTLVYNPMNITIGSIDIYTGLYPIAVSGYYVSIVYDKNIDTDFLKEVLLLPSSLKMYKNYATGSLIERQRVQYPTFSKLQLLLPNLDEQKAIGQLFKSLNLNITLHQRKLEHLQLQKKALLQQLFI